MQRESASIQGETINYYERPIARSQRDVFFHAQEVFARDGEVDSLCGDGFHNGHGLFLARACGGGQDAPLPVDVGGKRNLRPLGSGDVERHVALDSFVVRGADGLRNFGENANEGIAEGVVSVVDGGTHVLVGTREDLGFKEIFP